MNAARFRKRPDSKHRLAVDVLLGHGAKSAGVLRAVAMVAHHEKMALFNGRFSHVGSVFVLTLQIGLFDRLLVDVHDSVADLDEIARTADHPLDVGDGRIARIEENDDIAALDVAETVDELVDEEPFILVDEGLHRGSLNANRLPHKSHEEKANKNRDRDVMEEVPGRGEKRALLGGRLSRGFRHYCNAVGTLGTLFPDLVDHECPVPVIC